MKSNRWLFIALALLCVLNLVLLNKISSLNDNLYGVSSRISSLENQLYNSVSSIQNTISNNLEEQASLIIGTSYEYGEADIENGIINVSVIVTPKEYTADTEAYLISGSNEYPMTLDNGVFKADMQLSIYDDFSSHLVKFVNNDATKNEEIRLNLSPRYDFLPTMYARYRGQCTSIKEKNSYKATYNGQITINLERKGNPIEAVKIEMLEYLNGEEIARTDVPLNTTPIETQSADGMFIAAEEALTPYDSDWQGSKTYYYQLKEKDVSIPNGSVYEIYIELTDSLGLLHRMPADTREISKEGLPIDRASNYIDGATIYNAKTGQMLYQKTYSLVK